MSERECEHVVGPEEGHRIGDLGQCTECLVVFIWTASGWANATPREANLADALGVRQRRLGDALAKCGLVLVRREELWPARGRNSD